MPPVNPSTCPHNGLVKPKGGMKGEFTNPDGTINDEIGVMYCLACGCPVLTCPITITKTWKNNSEAYKFFSHMAEQIQLQLPKA